MVAQQGLSQLSDPVLAPVQGMDQTRHPAGRNLRLDLGEAGDDRPRLVRKGKRLKRIPFHQAVEILDQRR